MDRAAFVAFVRARGLGVVATREPGGDPQAALVGVAAADDGALLFDTSRRARKVANLTAHPRVAMVVGWEDEQTVQLEGPAEILTGEALARGQETYFAQFPDGRDRAESPEIVLVRVRPVWARFSDFRPGSFGSSEIVL